ncbi:MAG: response regulator, partial [Desulfonatronovibrionaceae bacterium]
MNSTLRQETEVGGVFPVKNPAQDIPREKITECKAKEPVPGLKIILAEDDPTNQFAMHRILKSLGHEVVVAENGQAVLDFLDKDKADIIFMDFQMPVMDGIEATRAIR